MSRALVASAVMMTIAISCFVDRRSEELTCETDSDCADVGADRECTDGYCVKANCPSICDGGCGTGKTCTVNCSNPNECRNGVTCPAGYTCVFNCTQDCTPVTCALGCTVNCSSNADCGPINCGAGATCSCVMTSNGTCR